MKISIVTACRNSVATLRDTMESVLRQKTGRVELEHIVVDGGSTDGTVDIIKEFGQHHRSPSPGSFSFRWISERDRGLYDAINKGIRMATGDVIGICNADDVLAEDDVIARIAGEFGPGAEGEPKIDAVYADVRFVREVGGKTVRYCTGRFFRKWMFRFATFPAHPSTFIRRECFDRYGFYSLDYPICADFELMLRFFYRGRIRSRYLPVCTHVMRMGGVSTKNARANVKINREDLLALKANGVWSCLPLIYLKYLFKIWGFVFRREK